MIAHYAGDTTFGGSYSTASGNVTVNPENSSVSMPGLVTGVDQNDNPTYSTSVVYGTGQFDAYLLRADVLNSAAASCRTTLITCPTGTIVFKDNNANLDGGTFTLNSEGYTEDQNIQLTGGSHTLKASYSGDPSYKASTTSVVVTVTTAPTTISSVTANPTSVGPSQNFTVTATIDSGSFGVAPTGVVTFLGQRNRADRHAHLHLHGRKHQSGNHRPARRQPDHLPQQGWDLYHYRHLCWRHQLCQSGIQPLGAGHSDWAKLHARRHRHSTLHR